MCLTQSVLVIALVLGQAQSWDIAVTAGDRIEFYTSDGTKTNTAYLNSQNLTAITYDSVHNMLLYVDKQNDKESICSYKIISQMFSCYTQRKGRNIQSLAFDPVSELLFFTDIKERSIYSLSFKPEFKNNIDANILIKMDDGIPTDIVVDSCRGYIYWVNRNLTPSTIERALFNGSAREVIIKAEYTLDLYSLAIGQQTQKIYWLMPETSKIFYLNSADLDGKNSQSLIEYTFSGVGEIEPLARTNKVTVSKTYVFVAIACSTCKSIPIWKYPKPTIKTQNHKAFLLVQTKSVVGIIANYKIQEQLQGISDCNHVLEDSIKITREYEGPFCDHGIKVNGQSLCKCTPGYTGVRCDVSICDQYCLHGICSLSEVGLPKCRCNAGYSGERCEWNVCNGYCLNNGSCFLNGNSEPVCQCTEDFVGSRCEESLCKNYCFQGCCSFSDEKLPVCSCNTGYSGERCEVNVCNGYCLNNGSCSLNEEDEPFCECEGEFDGVRCEVPIRLNKVEGIPDNKDGSLEGSGCYTNKIKTASNTSAFYLIEKNLTLTDLLENWHKHQFP